MTEGTVWVTSQWQWEPKKGWKRRFSVEYYVPVLDPGGLYSTDYDSVHDRFAQARERAAVLRYGLRVVTPVLFAPDIELALVEAAEAKGT